MDMTTVRARRAKAPALKAAGVEPADRDLVEVTSHGQTVAIVDAAAAKAALGQKIGLTEGQQRKAGMVWHHPAFDDSVGVAVLRLVQDALPVMEQGRHVFTEARA